MRFRHVYMIVLTLFTLVALFLASPDNGFIHKVTIGAGTIATVVLLAKSTIYIAMMHISRKGLFDYVNLEEAWKKAMENPIAAALALLAVVLSMFPIAFLIYVATVVA